MSTAFTPTCVPADERLPDGEEPFTTFGRLNHGDMDLRVFDQDTYWVDIHGTPHRLDEMSDDYLVNVVLHLREHAAYHHAGTLVRAVVQADLDTERGLPILPGLDPRVLRSIDPLDWIENTTLVRRIAQLLHPGPRST